LNHKIYLFYLAVRISFFLQTVGLRACSLNHALTGFFGGPALIRRGTDSSKTALAQSNAPGKLSSRAAVEARAAVPNIPME
jgi:hypothetical protein